MSFFVPMPMLRAPASLWKWGVASWAMASLPNGVSQRSTFSGADWLVD
jgi:hypothetical protein